MLKNKRGCRRAVSGLLLACLLACQMAGCSGQDGGGEILEADLFTQDAGNYKLAQAYKGDYVQTSSAQASINYPLAAQLVFENKDVKGARFDQYFCRTGDEVKAGDVLMTFTIEESVADVEEKEILLEQAKKDFEMEKQRRQRQMELEGQKLEELYFYDVPIQKLKMEKLQAQYDRYVFEKEREFRLQEKEIEETKESFSKIQVTAPFDGIIYQTAALNKGDPLELHMDLIQMYSPDKMLLRVDNSAGHLRYNMEVTVEAGPRNNRKSYPGRVVAAQNPLPDLVDSTAAYVELDTPLPEKELNAASIVGESVKLQDVLLVDRVALTLDEGKNFVSLYEDNMVKKRYVVVGQRNQDTAWIMDGLEDGQSVILD